MSFPKSLTRPVQQIPDDEIGATITNLLGEAAELLASADSNGNLSPDASETFGNIESSVAFLRTRERGIQMNKTFERNGMAGIVNRHEEPQTFRPIGGLPLLNFSEKQYREFHANVVAGTPQPMVMENFSVTAPPMATIPGDRLPPTPFSREGTRIADVLPTDTTEAAKVTTYTQTTAASAAAPVAEGAEKPESDPDWTAATIDVRKIAHYVDVSTESLDDYPAFRQVISEEMNAGLINAENAQLATGSGTGINITGLTNMSGILTYAPASAEARYRSIRRGIRNLRKGAAFAVADTILMHPDDEELFDLSNDTSAGLHAVADLNGGTTSPWGLKRVVTTGIAAGTGLLMDSRRAAVLYVRQPPTLLVDPYSQSKNNMVRIIVEERIALAPLNTACILKLTYNGSA